MQSAATDPAQHTMEFARISNIDTRVSERDRSCDKDGTDPTPRAMQLQAHGLSIALATATRLTFPCRASACDFPKVLVHNASDSIFLCFCLLSTEDRLLQATAEEVVCTVPFVYAPMDLRFRMVNKHGVYICLPQANWGTQTLWLLLWAAAGTLAVARLVFMVC